MIMGQNRKMKMHKNHNILKSKANDGSLRFLHKSRKRAFSVAEVLITLAVIGVVAGYVVPTINIKIQEQMWVSKLKRSYTLLNNSYQSAVRKYGSPKYWGLTPGFQDLESGVAYFTDSEKFYTRLLEGLKYEYVKDILPPQPTNYLNNSDKAILKDDGFEMQPLFRLHDGTTFFHSWFNKVGCTAYNTNACGDFTVDLNGADAPNVAGIDQFVFLYNESSIIPLGYPNHIQGTNNRTVESACLAKESIKYNGYGCTAWVIERGTMPWLKGKQPKWSK